MYGEAQQTLGRLHAKMVKEGLTPDEEVTWKEIRAMISQRVMDSAIEDLFDVKEPTGPEPKKARILASVVCRSCGEQVMETRARRFMEQDLCIPCFEELERRM